MLQHPQQVEAHDESGEDDGYSGTQLDEDVQCGTGGVLEGITHGVAYHGGLVAVGALSAMMPRLDILLGVIPGSTGVA